MSRFDQQRRGLGLRCACLAQWVAWLGVGGVAVGLVMLVMLATARPVLSAEPASSPQSPSQKSPSFKAPSLKLIRERIDAAGKLLDADKRDAAAESLGDAVRGLEALASAPRPPAGFKPLADRAASVRRRLEKAGVDVTGIVVPGIVVPGSGPATAATPPGRPATGAPNVGKAAAVSFARQVAPILAKSCGGCHIAGKKGGFQMASYEGLMQTGMVQRGQGQASRLVDVILTGDMPRGGGKVTSDEVATLIAWIDAGAPCDAPNPAIGIDVLARGGGGPAPRPVTPAVKPVPIKPGEVSFANDVAPLLQEHCLRCHGGDETESNLSMASLEALLKGGRTGEVVIAGKGEQSLLVKKLRGAGIEGQRMPLGRDPLSESETATIATWIDQGARLDMLTATAPLDTVVAAGRAMKLTDADLARVRYAAGEKLWRRAIPDEEPGVQPRAGVCVIGNLPAERLEHLADLAEAVAGDICGELRIDGPLLKGGVVIFALEEAVDYSAIWQNVSNAERPRGLVGHAGVSGEVVYGALLVPANQPTADLRARVADVVAAAAFAGRSAPAWFSQGAGRATAGRIAPKAEVVQQWKRDAAAAIPRLGSTADFLAGHSDPAATAAAAGGFVVTLATGSRLAQMIEALDGGAAFDEAFNAVFHATPAQAFEKWASRVVR